MQKEARQKSDLPKSMEAKPQYQLAPVVERMNVSATLEMGNLVKSLRKQGRQISNFGLGQSPFGAPEMVKKALIQNAHRTDYLPAEGIVELRTAIADFYQRYFKFDINAEQVIVGPGSKQLIYQTMIALNCPWLFITPSWVSYETQAKLAGIDYWKLAISADDEYRITATALREKYIEIEEQLQGRSLVILLNYPNNPTGLSISKEEIREIARFARNNEIIILSDEIYGNITHPSFGQEHYSIAREYPEGTIVTGGISKDRSMGGYRLGVAIYPKAEKNLINAMRSIGSETYSAVAAPIQYAAITAYEAHPEIDSYIKHTTTIHQLVGSYVYEHLNASGLQLSPPEGGFYLFPSLNHRRATLHEQGIDTSKDLVKYLILEYGVASIPGTAFGLNAEDLSFRLAYIDYDGQDVLEAYLKDPEGAVNNPHDFISTHCPRIEFGVKQLSNAIQALLN